MHDLLLDVADSMFSASSTTATSEPHFARMLDLSIFARNAFVPSTSAVGRFPSFDRYIISIIILNFVNPNLWAPCDNFFPDAWVPARSAKGEYLQIELSDVISVYGLELEGSVDLKSYVSSLLIMYSDDGHIYHQYVNKQNTPKVTNLKL